MRESWKAYWQGLRKRGWEFAGGAVLGLLGLALTIHPTAMPPWFWFLVAIAAVGWLGFTVFHDIRVERDEAQAALRQPFPNMKIHALMVSRADEPDYPLISVPLAVTNREPTRVSLDFQIWVELSKEPGRDLPLSSEASIVRSREIYETAMRGERIRSEINLVPTTHIEPRTTEKFELRYGWWDSLAEEFADPPPNAHPDYQRSPFNQEDRLRLDVVEHVSGQTISLYIPGSYETRGMVEA